MIYYISNFVLNRERREYTKRKSIGIPQEILEHIRNKYYKESELYREKPMYLMEYIADDQLSFRKVNPL